MDFHHNNFVITRNRGTKCIACFTLFNEEIYIPSHINKEIISYFFILTGTMSVLWLIEWLFEEYESPRVHPRISKAELHHIEDSLIETGVKEKEVSPRSIRFKTIG